MRAAHKPVMILELRVFDAWRFRQEQTAHRMTGRGPRGPLFFVRVADVNDAHRSAGWPLLVVVFVMWWEPFLHRGGRPVNIRANSNLYLVNIVDINRNTFHDDYFICAIYAILTTMFFNLRVR